MHNLSQLNSERFDVLVIGGGLTGAGVALDAAARGYSVALVEKVDFASGTSSKSTFISEQGKIQGAHIHDRIGNQDLVVHARHVVNATGVFSEEVEALTGTESLVQVQPSKGVHLVLSREDLKLGDAAIVLPETEDKRILFIVPWESEEAKKCLKAIAATPLARLASLSSDAKKHPVFRLPLWVFSSLEERS